MRRSFAVLALCGAVALTACGGGEPSVRAEPDPSTTTTSTTVPEPTTTTTGTGVTTTTTPVRGRVLRYQGLRFVVPRGWPVHDLAARPRTCVRVDVHAVYLGTPGGTPHCPARLVGHTETIQVQPLASASQIAVARATQATVVNGMAVRVDPDPDANGALTVVFPDLGLVAFLTYGESSALAHEILAGFTLASP